MLDQDVDRRPARRQEIVAAAYAIAAEDGWPAVSVRRVAARVGCSAAALYQYLPDKEAILRTIAAAGEDRLAAALRRAAAGEPAGVCRLSAVAAAYLDFALENPEFYQVMHGLDGVPRLGPAPLDGPVGAMLRDVAAGLAADLGLDEASAGLARRLLALLHGHAALALAGGKGGDPAELLQAAVVETVRGLTAAARPLSPPGRPCGPG